MNLMTIVSYGQRSEKNKFLLGLSVNPIIPNNMVQNNNLNIVKDSMTFKLYQKPAFSFGMDIRYGFQERFSLHSGINYCNRRFKVDVYENDTVYIDSLLKFISYDIPVYLSGYVKLTRNMYLNGNLGFAVDFYPTNISIPHVYGKRYHWAQFSLIGGIGLEYRTQRSGYFYLGGTYKTHFHDMLYVLLFRGDVIGEPDESFSYSGNYFNINLRYYLP
jgi:hypothetical protein